MRESVGVTGEIKKADELNIAVHFLNPLDYLNKNSVAEMSIIHLLNNLRAT